MVITSFRCRYRHMFSDKEKMLFWNRSISNVGGTVQICKPPSIIKIHFMHFFWFDWRGNLNNNEKGVPLVILLHLASVFLRRSHFCAVMIATLRIRFVYVFLMVCFVGAQQSHCSNLPSYGLCEAGDAITSLNGSIINNLDGIDCTRLILAPSGYRIEVTAHPNNYLRDGASILVLDGARTHNNSQVSKLYSYRHSYLDDKSVTSTSNAVLVHIDKLTSRTFLNVTFVAFRQSPKRCECLPVSDGETVCTTTREYFYFDDQLERECNVMCREGHYRHNHQSPGLRIQCPMDHNTKEGKWTAISHDDSRVWQDDQQITCSKIHPAVLVGYFFKYNNISCQDLDLAVIQGRVREHVLNISKLVLYAGECFKDDEAKNSPNCTVESLNVTCSGLNNGTTSQIELLVEDNIIASPNETITVQKYQILKNMFDKNLTESLKQFIARNLVIHNTNATDLKLIPMLIPSCPENKVYNVLAGGRLGYGCVACPENFYKTSLLTCTKCPNGTRQKSNEQKCVPGPQVYPKPSYNYCQHTCEVGKFFNNDSALCEWCPYGTYQNTTKVVNPVCRICSDGKTTGFVGARDVSECIDLCPAGYYLQYTTCKMCGVGYFMPNKSNRFYKCYQCPVGNTTLGVGSTSAGDCVKKCSTGQYFNMTTRACLHCPNDTYQDEVKVNNTRNCKTCPANTVTLGPGSRSSSACLGQCAPGHYVDIHVKRCELCPRNTYQDMAEHASFSCKLCDKYKITQNVGSMNISACIYSCSQGEFFNKTSKTCEKCGINTYQDEVGKDICNLCPGKTFTVKLGSKRCLDPCQFGQFLNKSAEQCQDCPNGYYQNISDYMSESCFPCPLDFYNDKLGRQNCTACPDKTVTVLTGATRPSECIGTCKPGSFLNQSRKSCQECLKGFYQGQKDYRLEHCTKCPSANLTTLEAGASSVVQCVGYCASFPCLNGGECANIDNNFNCTCPKFIKGKRCGVITDEKDTDEMEVAIRFPGLVWNQNLSNPQSKEFLELAKDIENSVRQEFKNDKTFRTVKVKEFQQGSVISDLNFNYVAGVEFKTPVDTLSSAIADGTLGNLTTDKSSIKVVNFTCTQPLGMENGRIPDDAITAGVSRNYHPPQNARLNNLGPGWAPLYLSGDDVYLQVDFGEEVILTAVATQGSSYHGGSWLSAYYLQYSLNGSDWKYYQTSGIPYDVFPANSDVNTTVRKELNYAVKVRYIRILEYHFKEWISYRVEFYGCPIPKSSPLPTQPPPTFPTPTNPATSPRTPSLKTVDDDDDDNDSNVGLIVGLVVGLLVLGCLVAVVIWWVLKRNGSHSFGNASTVNIMQLKEKPTDQS